MELLNINLTKKNYFIIIFIIAISIGLMRMINPDSILISGIILAGIISYIYVVTLKNNKSEELYKLDSFYIKPSEILLDYPDIINFLYSINEYFEYDMNSFSDLITELNSFFILYKKIDKNCIQYYDNLLGIKLKLVNILSNYIYSIPEENKFVPKIKEFDIILQKYLDSIECNINDFKRNKPYPANMLS
jgi:hypothetical protein